MRNPRNWIIVFLLINCIGLTVATVMGQQRPTGDFSTHFGCETSMELRTDQPGWIQLERWTLKDERQKANGAGEKVLICKYIYTSASLREDETPVSLTLLP
jgi:hypothetical protein